MKVKPNYLHEAAEADKRNDARRDSAARSARRAASDNAEAATTAKPLYKEANSPAKDESKFANLLESSAKTEKPKEREDSGEERRDDQKKEKKEAAAREKDLNDAANSSDSKTGKYDSSSGGGNFGGQSNFGAGDFINQASLNDAFAARSILHVADLERLISTIRTQINLNGRREIVLQLRRSVLEGLRVKITTEAGAKVQIAFLATSEDSRRQVERHAGELADILRGRGINLQSLTTTLDSGKNDFSDENETQKISNSNSIPTPETNEDFADNTFASEADEDGKIYQA